VLPSRLSESFGAEVEASALQRSQSLLHVATAEVEVRKAREDPPPSG
jgi:hypothetical protein